MLTPRFDDALRFANDLHRAQVRKGNGSPYIAHLMAVASLVLEDGGGEDEAIGALLHDAIEDQGDSYAGGRDGLRTEIERRFGGLVIEIVNGCTDDDGFVKGKAATPAEEAAAWRLRKQAYLDRLPRKRAPVLRVSCADKLHNARSIVSDFHEHGEAVWKRFRAKRGSDHLWYYSELCRIFLEVFPGNLARELQRTVRNWERILQGE